LPNVKKKAFNVVDKDRSGTIDIDELFEVLRLMYPGISNPECNRIYDLVDSNRSGEITYEE
jgi:Ca2+-binding EF-hand superfamily protein